MLTFHWEQLCSILRTAVSHVFMLWRAHKYYFLKSTNKHHLISYIGNYNQNKEIGYHKVKQVFNQSGKKFSINTHGHMTCSKLFTHCLNLYDTAFQYSHMNWDITSQKPHNWINKIWYPDKIFIASVENIRTTSLCTLYSACKMLAKCSVLVI